MRKAAAVPNREGRAAHGMQIVATVSQQLTGYCGGGLGHTELTRTVLFAGLVPGEAIVVTLSRQLSGSHLKEAPSR